MAGRTPTAVRPAFVIPSGKQLIITDVKWRAQRDVEDGNAIFTDGLPIFV